MPRRPRVRVVPANETLRKILKHPTGVAFRDEGAVEWPHDRFTRRRLADGSIKLEEKKEQAKPQHEKTRQQPQERSAEPQPEEHRQQQPHRAPPAHE
jgi:hypothetical protein